MKTTFVAAVAVIAALSVSAFAQDKGPAPASKAEVQKLVDSIKGDKAKLAQFCDLNKLDDQLAAASEKKDEKKVEELSKQEEAIGNKIGPDFNKVMSGVTEETSSIVEELAKGCGK